MHIQLKIPTNNNQMKIDYTTLPIELNLEDPLLSTQESQIHVP